MRGFGERVESKLDVARTIEPIAIGCSAMANSGLARIALSGGIANVAWGERHIIGDVLSVHGSR